MGASASPAPHDGADGALVFQPRLPHRGMGWFLVFMSSLGVLLIFIAVMVITHPRNDPERPADPMEGPFFLGFGIVATLAFLLPGLYLGTRRRRVRVAPSGVEFHAGWCLHRTVRRHALAEFAGLYRFSRDVGTADAGTVAATAAGVAAAIVTGTGIIAGKVVTLHYLALKHLRDSSLNVVIACRRDSAAVHALHKALAKRLSVNMIVPTLTGYDILKPDEIDQPLLDRLATQPLTKPAAPPSAPRLAVPPVPRSAWPPETIAAQVGRATFGADTKASQPSVSLAVARSGDVVTVGIPLGIGPLVAGAALAAACYGIAMLFLIVGRSEKGPDPYTVAAVLAAIGTVFLLVGYFNSRRRSTLILTSAGLQFRQAIGGSPAIFVPWKSIQHVSVAREPTTRKAALLLSADPNDVWLAAGQKEDVLNYLRDLTLEHARQAGAAS